MDRRQPAAQQHGFGQVQQKAAAGRVRFSPPAPAVIRPSSVRSKHCTRQAKQRPTTCASTPRWRSSSPAKNTRALALTAGRRWISCNDPVPLPRAMVVLSNLSAGSTDGTMQHRPRAACVMGIPGGFCGIRRRGPGRVLGPKVRGPPTSLLRLISDTLCKIETVDRYLLRSCCISATLLGRAEKAAESRGVGLANNSEEPKNAAAEALRFHCK
jgi:hypothetical protein